MNESDHLSKAAIAERMRNKVRERRQMAVQGLGGRCVSCSTTENLEFDHVDRTKKSFNLSGNWTAAAHRLDAELAKCQLLCRPCHIEKTIQERDAAVAHGTPSMYTKKNCRCRYCTDAIATYWRNRRRLLRNSTN